jgi:predicted ribosome quality control (RQC) complex YloA/Tae2 family protein
LGGRIQKIKHPFPDAIILEIYSHRVRQNLLVSIQPTSARLHLASGSMPAAPEDVTPLLLLMRKHIVGARIVDVQQPDLERVVFLSICTSQPPSKFTLAIELMGRHSNVILLDENDLILDSLKRVPPSLSSHRPVLPKLRYLPPPLTGKLDWRHTSADDLLRIASESDLSKPLWTWLLSTFAGLGSDTCRELVFRAYTETDVPLSAVTKDPERLIQAFHWLALVTHHGRWEPTLVQSGEEYLTVLPFRPTCPMEGSLVPVASMSRAVELFYASQSRIDRLGNLRARAAKGILARRERALRRVQALKEALERTKGADELISHGQLLLAFGSQVPRGAQRVTIEGTTIELDPNLDPVRNAQRKFDDGKRLRKAAELVGQKLEEAQAEVEFWEEQMAMAELADSADILHRLLQEALPQSSSSKKVSHRQHLTVPLSDGSKAIIGRTGMENLQILSLASPEDHWLHVKDYPGSHVLVKPKKRPLPDQVLLEAASYAAYFSRARTQPRVEVMVAEARQVRKKPGASPGRVVVKSYWTVRVEPKSPLTGEPG